jgi:signal transduction histidine kinase
MIENATDNDLNIRFDKRAFNTASGANRPDQQKDFAANNGPQLRTIEISSGSSSCNIAIDPNDAIRTILQFSPKMQETSELLAEIARIFVDMLGSESACIFESDANGQIKSIAEYPRKQNAACSIESTRSDKSTVETSAEHILNSLSAMTNALDKNETVRVWQVSTDHNDAMYAICLPIMYDPAKICGAAIFSKDIKMFSDENIRSYRLVSNLAAFILDGFDQKNALGKKQLECITLQEENRRLMDQIEALNNNSAFDQENLRKELEALSYSISHDLRAPLRAINGNCQWLNRLATTDIDSECRRILAQIGESSQNMEKLLDGLLEFSKVANSEPNYKLIDMSALVQKAGNELVQADGAPSTLSLSIKPLVDAYGDEILVNQVWRNLISNAIKFSSPRRNRKIEIDSFQLNGDITYFVIDNGVGFDMKYADQLFHAFHRLHGVEEFEGSGIGLAIVNRIIKRHGGRVWAEGKIDGGAKFFFTLPKRQLKNKS